MPVIQFLRQAVSGTGRRGPLGARGPHVDARVDEAPRAWTPPSVSATSTRGSPAARRSATRSCRWPCSNPSWPCWTRPTRASTSTRCAIVADGVAGRARRAARARGAARHPLHPHPRAPASRRRARAGRRPDRRAAAGPSWPIASRPRATSRGGGDRDQLPSRPPRAVTPSGPCPTSDVDFSKLKADFPVLEPHRARPARRLPRLGLVVAAPTVRARRHGHLLPDDARQRAPRRLHDRRGGRPALRGGPRGGGPASSVRPTPSTR